MFIKKNYWNLKCATFLLFKIVYDETCDEYSGGFRISKRRAADCKRLGANPLIGQFVPKHWIKMKEIGPRGASLDAPME